MNRHAAFCNSSLDVQRPKTKEKIVSIWPRCSSLTCDGSSPRSASDTEEKLGSQKQTQSACWSLSCTTLRLWLPLCFFRFGCFSSSPLFRNRLQRADSRPSVGEDGAVMFLSADKPLNEPPTVSLNHISPPPHQHHHPLTSFVPPSPHCLLPARSISLSDSFYTSNVVIPTKFYFSIITTRF